MEKSMLKQGIALILTILAGSQVYATSVESDVFQILKSKQHWGLVQPGTACIEYYQFKNNGEVQIKSHQERIFGTYQYIATTQNFELPAVMIHFEKDNQKTDCKGDASNQAGTSTTNFLKKQSDQKIFFCNDALGKDCPVYLQTEH